VTLVAAQHLLDSFFIFQEYCSRATQTYKLYLYTSGNKHQALFYQLFLTSN
jgi:hypothetical protein